MKIYVVNNGKYDCVGVGLVSEDLDVVVEFIGNTLGVDDLFDGFNNLECWENGKKLYYTTRFFVGEDIKSEIKKIEDEL